MLFFQCKTNDFHSPRSRLARYGAVSEGLAGPYWPSQTTSKPPLDLQKIVTNLIIFAHPAPSGPSCRSKGTHKCLGIRFKQKHTIFIPVLVKLTFSVDNAPPFSHFFFTFGCQLASKIAFAALPCPRVASRAVAETIQKRRRGGHLGPLVVPVLNFFSRSPLLSCFMVLPALRDVLFSSFLSSDPAFWTLCCV